jgi:hypothetical protein
MLMRFHHLLSLLLPLLFLAGCATSQPENGSDGTFVLVPDHRLRGRIAQLNSPGQFVVVDFNVGAIPPLPSPMKVYRGNDVVGVIRLTGPARDHLVVGDLIQGEAAAGDEAVWDPLEKEEERKEER